MNLEKRHIILIAIAVAVVVVFLAVAIYCLITPPPPEYTVYTIAPLVFDFLDKWAIVLSATVTLLLAIAAFWVIAENRRIRAEDRKLKSKLRSFDENRRSLEEICNWAEKGIATLISAGASSSQDILEMDDTLPTIAAKNISIMDDARSLPNDKLCIELIKKVDKAASDLQEFIRFLDLKKQSAALEPEYIPKRQNLKESFENVIEVASKLKVALKDQIMK